MLKNTLAMPSTLLAAALLAAASAPALAVEAFTAQYNASALGMVGEGQMSVSPQPGNRWQYTLSVRNQAVDLSQKTVFDVQDGRMRPLSSSDTSRLLIKKKNVNTVYDWSKAQATWSGDVKPDRAGPVKLAAGDMDALLVNLAIVRDVTERLAQTGEAVAPAGSSSGPSLAGASGTLGFSVAAPALVPPMTPLKSAAWAGATTASEAAAARASRCSSRSSA